MAAVVKMIILSFVTLFAVLPDNIWADDVIGCGGFIKSKVEINFSLIELKLYTKQGSLKYTTDCAPHNGYYMVPIYDKGDYVLKVEALPGWTFEPQSLDLLIDGKTDKCSRGEDINFEFTGFGVIGNVISKGQTSGPSGVQLSLMKSDTRQVIQKTTSISGGSYTFEKVLPGDYVVTATHPTWSFETSSVSVSVSRETGNAGSIITVTGYDIKGSVLSDGEPVHGVHFILYSSAQPLPTLKDCHQVSVTGIPQLLGYTPICDMQSSASGGFNFTAVPCGRYVLVPFYKGENIKFDVIPERLELVVEHESVDIKQPFKVAGFTVGGFVRTTKSGRGVPNAKVIINGKLQATTGEGGMYHLDGMTAGSYRLSVEAPLMTFDAVTVKITPNTPQLPDIIATKFAVCGKILIDKLPEGLSTEPKARSVHIHKQDGGQLYLSTKASIDGRFCVDCAPGKYLVSVELREDEVKAGLKLAPDEKEISVVDQSIDDIIFSQFSAKIRGSVSCLDKCSLLQLSLTSIGRSDDRRIVEAVENNRNAEFVFDDVMPGKYKVTLLNEQWCWKPKTLDVEVIDKDLSAVDFVQSGFILSCTLSHAIQLNFEQEHKPENSGSFNLTKGVNKFCLTESGVYKLRPISCHQFEEDVYHYDTAHPSVLALTALKHLVEGVVTTQQLHSDIVITLRSSLDQVQTVLGPLELLSSNKDTQLPPSPPFSYKFTHLAKTGEKLSFSAASGQLLFTPDTVDVTVRGDSCSGVAVVFAGRLGVFIEGQIYPAIESVEISISEVNKVDKKTELLTDEKGFFRVGPLDPDTKYDIGAFKEGYVFTQIIGKPGHFESFKLGEISAAVDDNNGNPLLGVLLSLSGSSDNFRRNNVTQDGGVLLFSSLSPGQYFLKPMMKEYKFEPSSQMIDVLDGTTVQLRITGTRVAFSCYGSVLSLNGEPEPGVYLEAVGQPNGPKCGQHQEETKTELDGTYRIRGLQPGCEYIVQLKSGAVNSHIERSTPTFRRISVTKENLNDVNIIAFRRISQMDISGLVYAPQEFVSSLKVNFFKESRLDSPIQSISLGPTSFFYPPSVAIDNQVYVLKLASSLSRNIYEYTLDEVQFVANTSYKHFTLKFQPQRKTVEQELSHSSILVLPLTIFVLYLVYNYQQVLPFVRQYLSSLQAYAQRPTSSPTHQQAATPASGDVYSTSTYSLADTANTLKKKLKAKKIE